MRAAKSQINRLSEYLLTHFPNEEGSGKPEDAIDTAMRLLDKWQLLYDSGYDQGRFDVLFDLWNFLVDNHAVNVLTGEKQDVVDPTNVEEFERMGLKRGMVSLSEIIGAPHIAREAKQDDKT